MRLPAIAVLVTAVVSAGCASPAGEGARPSASNAPMSLVPTASTPPASAPESSASPSAAGSPAATDPLLALELVDVRTGQSFSLADLAAEKPVLLETMAIWCSNCLSQQREVVRAHELAEFHSVGIDVDPNERAPDLADYADREGFDWHFVVADGELVRLLTERFGFQVTNPPSTPTFVVADGAVRALDFGRFRSAEELVQELGSG